MTTSDAESIRIVRHLASLVSEAETLADRLREMDARLPAIIATGARLAFLTALREKVVALRELRAVEAAVRACAAANDTGGRIEGYQVSGVGWLNLSAPLAS